MRKTLHLVQKGVKPMQCLGCGAKVISPNEMKERLLATARGEKPPITQEGKRWISAPAVCYNRTDWDTIYVNNKDYRRCIDPPDPNEKLTYPEPVERGFYWAEWRVAEDATPKQEDSTPMFNPEVVWVYLDDIEKPLKVDVFGVSVPQGLDCFVWRSGKLEPPKSAPKAKTRRKNSAVATP